MSVYALMANALSTCSLAVVEVELFMLTPFVSIIKPDKSECFYKDRHNY